MCLAAIYLPWALVVTLGCDTERHASTLTVFAASSLASVLPEIGSLFEGQNPGTKISFSFAGSSILAKQIAAGAPADIYISANADWVNFLLKKQLIRAGGGRVILRNRLVLVVPASHNSRIRHLNDLLSNGVRRISLADWSHVPAGIYAKEALQRAGIWAEVAQKCLPALDVRAALAYVERGETDCGVVYRTDAAISKHVRIALELPPEVQPKIEYVAAIPARAAAANSHGFLSFLNDDTVALIFENAGFEPIRTSNSK